MCGLFKECHDLEAMTLMNSPAPGTQLEGWGWSQSKSLGGTMRTKRHKDGDTFLFGVLLEGHLKQEVKMTLTGVCNYNSFMNYLQSMWLHLNTISMHYIRILSWQIQRKIKYENESQTNQSHVRPLVCNVQISIYIQVSPACKVKTAVALLTSALADKVTKKQTLR